MSTVKTNNAQIGQSVTATNNFTWYQPSSPDGTVRLGNGNSGSVTDLVTLTSAGNLGIGTSSPGSKLQVNGTSTFLGSGGASVQWGDTSNLGALSFDGSGNPLVRANTGLPLVFQTNGANERMRLDSSGNLGLGVTPSAWGSTFKALQEGAGSLWSYSTSGFGFTANAYNNSGWKYVNNGYANSFETDTGKFIWYTAPSGTAGNAISFTQAMTLDASGNLLVGTTTAPSTGKLNVSSGMQLTGNSTGNAISSNNGSAEVAYLTLGKSYNLASNYDIALVITNIATTAGKRIYVQNRTAGVYLSDGGTSWTSNSDERLKTDLKPIENAAQKVSTLRAVTGRYIADEEGVSRSFLIAQDVQAVLPEAVDASDPDKLGVQYTDTIPLLVAAIKELSAELNELKQKVNA